MARIMKANKYEYSRILQENHGNGWDDSIEYTAINSRFEVTKETRKEIKADFEAYRNNCPSGQYRVINRKKLKA